jgi:HD-like signal output (HDOD) protein
MQVAQDPKSSAADLAVVVSADPGLSATMLRVINSAAYRRQREVTSVQDALVMLGFVQARNIAISGAIAGSYAPDALNALFRIDVFWRHSLSVAFRAAQLATESRKVDAPSAFTAGIVHNMGRLAIFFADPAGLDQAVAEAMRRDVPLDEVERELLGYDHAELGELLAEKWRLPADVRSAVAHHHDKPGDSGPTLTSVVGAADRYCVSHGLLPGYVVPTARTEVGDAQFAKLKLQVDSLMELVNGAPAGVRFN